MKPTGPTLSSLAPEQPHATAVLRRLGKSARRPHALALVGPAASGVGRMGEALAAALLCEAPIEPFDACQRCSSCLQRQRGQPTRLLRLGEETDAPGVAEVRALEGRLQMTTRDRAGRVVLVPRGCQLRLPAQNALLKVLEEPPSGTTFLVLAERYALVLPTVRSRLVRVQLAMPPLNIAHERLTAGGIASELVPLLVPFVGTDLDAAKQWVELGMASLLDDLRAHLALGTPSHETARFAQRLGQQRPLGQQALALLEVLMRDALAYKLGARAALGPQGCARALWIEADSAQIRAAIERLEHARTHEVFNLNRALLCETLLLTLNRRDTPA